MRSFLALFATAAIVSSTGTKCAQNDIEELVSRTTCGCSKSISECLGANVDLERLEDIEKCFITGGCSEAGATVGAVWFARNCNEETGTDDREDLKKRADTTESGSSTNAKTTAKTTGETTAKTTEATTTSEPSTAAATTTSDSTSASAAASSTTTSPSSTTTTDSTTSTSSTDSTTTTAASATGTLVCMVTSTKSTSACSIHAGTTVTCTPTVTAITSCAPGLLCFSPTAGANSCMKKNDTLTTSGLVVTIAFAAGIGSAIFSWAIIGLRARNRRRHNEQVRQMMASSGKGRAASDVEAVSAFSRSRTQGMKSEANLPLITPGGTRSDQPSYGQQEEYFEQQGSGGNSLTPTGREGPGAPKLHPGLGALGQETRYQ